MCNPCQKLLLKTASSVCAVELEKRLNKPDKGDDVFASLRGKAEFKLSYIANCHPVESYKATLNKDIHTLIVMGLLVEVNETKSKPRCVGISCVLMCHMCLMWCATLTINLVLFPALALVLFITPPPPSPSLSLSTPASSPTWLLPVPVPSAKRTTTGTLTAPSALCTV